MVQSELELFGAVAEGITPCELPWLKYSRLARIAARPSTCWDAPRLAGSWAGC
jgi:hypothetical protein